MASNNIKKHYKDIAYKENSARIKLLVKFKVLVGSYFANSTLNMVSGEYSEKQQAGEAREAINLILKKVYEIIRLADIKTYSAANTTLSAYRQGKSIDLILNLFNLGRNEIPPSAAIEYIERAIDVYRSNRLPAFIRTINPFFWIKYLLQTLFKINL